MTRKPFKDAKPIISDAESVAAEDAAPAAEPPASRATAQGTERNMKPSVILVGADKGGVGKTTVARAALDYLASNNVITRAFDTEFPRGTLHRFHPHETNIVDLTSTSDQMRILDTLNDLASEGQRDRRARRGHALGDAGARRHGLSRRRS